MGLPGASRSDGGISASGFQNSDQNSEIGFELSCLDRAAAHGDLAMGDPPHAGSLRHTVLARLGEAVADAFTIMKIAGHSATL